MTISARTMGTVNADRMTSIDKGLAKKARSEPAIKRRVTRMVPTARVMKLVLTSPIATIPRARDWSTAPRTSCGDGKSDILASSEDAVSMAKVVGD